MMCSIATAQEVGEPCARDAEGPKVGPTGLEDNGSDFTCVPGRLCGTSAGPRFYAHSVIISVSKTRAA